jgi:hypothetical protein
MGLPDPAVALNARVDQSRVWVTTFLGEVIISADNRNNTIRTLNFTLSRSRPTCC